MATYKGVTFKNWQKNKTLGLTDVELVKQDLLNHIFTRRGTRVHQRGYGTIIYDLLFEPMTEDTVTLISDQVKTVLNADPRISILTPNDYEVIPYYERSFVYIRARLYFLELDLVDVLDINLEFNT